MKIKQKRGIVDTDIAWTTIKEDDEQILVELNKPYNIFENFYPGDRVYLIYKFKDIIHIFSSLYDDENLVPDILEVLELTPTEKNIINDGIRNNLGY